MIGRFRVLMLLVLAVWFLWPASVIGFDRPNQAPSWSHWLGTTASGEDIIGLCFVACQQALRETGLATLGALVVGSFLAGVASQTGRIPRSFLSLASNFLDAIGPVIPLSAMLVVNPKPSVMGLTLMVSAITWPMITTPLLSELLAAQKLPYVQAAKAIGASQVRILVTHILPSILSRLLPQCAALFVTLVGLFTAMQFLGVSTTSARPIGFIVYEASGQVRQTPWYFCAAVLSLGLMIGPVQWLTREGKRDVRKKRTICR